MQMLESQDQNPPIITPATAEPAVESSTTTHIETVPVVENLPATKEDLASTGQPVKASEEMTPTVNISVTLREEGDSALIVASSIDEDGPILGPRPVSRKDLGPAVIQLFVEFLPMLKDHKKNPKPAPAPAAKPVQSAKSTVSQKKKQTVTPKTPPSFVGSVNHQPNPSATQGAFSF